MRTPQAAWSCPLSGEGCWGSGERRQHGSCEWAEPDTRGSFLGICLPRWSSPSERRWVVVLQSVSQFAPLRVSLPILARSALSLGDLGSDSDFHRMCRLRRVGHLALQPPGIQPLEAVTQSVYSDIESVKRRECSKAPAKLEGPQGWTPSRDGGGGTLLDLRWSPYRCFPCRVSCAHECWLRILSWRRCMSCYTTEPGLKGVSSRRACGRHPQWPAALPSTSRPQQRPVQPGSCL